MQLEPVDWKFFQRETGLAQLELPVEPRTLTCSGASTRPLTTAPETGLVEIRLPELICLAQETGATEGIVEMRRCATTLEAEMTAAEHDLLCQTLQNLGRSGQHLEIGTAAGGTLCAMLGSFPGSKRPPFVVVDPMSYFPNQLQLVQQNLQNHGLSPEAVDFRVGTSADAFPAAVQRQESFDFMLIDGCHKIRSVMTDLKWTRLLAVGGIVCFHDYTPEHRGVWLAVNRFLSRHPHYQQVAQADSLLVVKKTAHHARPEVSAADELYARAWYLPLQIERKWKKLRRAA